jgi:MFS transporter, DHA2 family, multidrug resistance protein
MAAATTSSADSRVAITILVILAALMQTLDTTIVNVALPYMQGSVSASQDQIDWVLTSYITAAAIMTPPTGFLAGRFGVKRLFLVSIAGFTAASMLCGLAESLTEIVLFRVLQGAFGAAMIPLAQSMLLSIYPKERHGFAMALFGMGVVVGPVLGPVLGGWLTEFYSWRYVFYINGPLGVFTLLGLMTFLPESPRNSDQRLDWFGFAALSVALGAFQIMLDRGEMKDWFGSAEVVTEALVAVSASYLFLVHNFTTAQPFVRPALLRDRNFAAGVIFSAIVFATLYASLALQPPYLQGLMNYPVLTAGLVMGPRGLGTMAAMIVIGRLGARIDTRLLLAIGLGLSAWSFYLMTGWTPDISQQEIVGVGLLQGVGFGFIFVPLTTAALATLSPAQRTEGAGFFNLARNIGSSVGISVFNALLISNTQVNHAALTTHISPINRGFASPIIAQFWDPLTAAGRAALDAMVTQQAQIIAYIDDNKLLMIATLALVPLLFLFKASRDSSHATVAEA